MGVGVCTASKSFGLLEGTPCIEVFLILASFFLCFRLILLLNTPPINHENSNELQPYQWVIYLSSNLKQTFISIEPRAISGDSFIITQSNIVTFSWWMRSVKLELTTDWYFTLFPWNNFCFSVSPEVSPQWQEAWPTRKKTVQWEEPWPNWPVHSSWPNCCLPLPHAEEVHRLMLPHIFQINCLMPATLQKTHANWNTRLKGQAYHIIWAKTQFKL